MARQDKENADPKQPVGEPQEADQQDDVVRGKDKKEPHTPAAVSEIVLDDMGDGIVSESEHLAEEEQTDQPKKKKKKRAVVAEDEEDE